MVEPDWPQMTIKCMQFVCWITQATDIRSEYVIRIAVPWQQLLTGTCLSVTLYVHCLCCLFFKKWDPWI